MRELKIGDPREISTHVGPVIEAEAKRRLDSWIADMADAGRRALSLRPPATLPAGGTYVLPALIELDRARELKEEVFGPVLHVVRWKAEELDAPARRYRRQQHRTDAWRPFAHRQHHRARRGAPPAWQRLCQPQHDRRRRRHPAVRRHLAIRHRAEGRRAQLPAPLRHRAGLTVNTAAAGGNAGLLALDD